MSVKQPQQRLSPAKSGAR